MKNLATISILVIFVFDSILMPYGNFNDNYAARLLSKQQQKEDPDLGLTGFIFEKLLSMSDPFEDDDRDHPPLKSSQPIQSLQIQAGYFECYKLAMKMQDPPETVAKPTCFFKENKLGREFSTSIFRPPAVMS